MRSYSREFRIEVVERIQRGEKISQLARELGIHRKLLYDWKRRVEAGGEANLRERGRPRKIDISGEGLGSTALRISQLERTIAHQHLIIEFFRHALQRVETERHGSSAIGATASSSPSRR